MDIFPSWVGWLVAGALFVILLALVTSDWWRNRRNSNHDPNDSNDAGS